MGADGRGLLARLVVGSGKRKGIKAVLADREDGNSLRKEGKCFAFLVLCFFLEYK